ncbi:hypothetical protein [Roseivirga pacifica]
MRQKVIGLFLLSLLSTYMHAQEEVSAIIDSVFVKTDIFEPDRPAKISLEMDIKAFRKNKFKEEYQNAKLTYGFYGEEGTVTKNVRVKARGNFRKQKCFFPPIKLNIRKAGIENEYLANTKTIKLVTHCKSASVNQVYLLREFLVYKLYQVIEPNSFRVRLLEIEYVDSGKRRPKNLSTWGFFIEPEGVLAERLGMVSVKSDNLSQEQMNEEVFNRLAMFQYMVGNADYSVPGRHNLKVLAHNNVANYEGVPVPYDFDYSGFVNASYAIPGEELGISSVRERYFLGACMTESQTDSLIKEFERQKPLLMRVISEFEYLSDKEKQVLIEYVEEFFLEASKRNFYRSSILSTCK